MPSFLLQRSVLGLTLNAADVNSVRRIVNVDRELSWCMTFLCCWSSSQLPYGEHLSRVHIYQVYCGSVSEWDFPCLSPSLTLFFFSSLYSNMSTQNGSKWWWELLLSYCCRAEPLKMSVEVIATPVASHALMLLGDFCSLGGCSPCISGDPLSYSNASVSQFTALCLSTRSGFSMVSARCNKSVSEEMCSLLGGLWGRKCRLTAKSNKVISCCFL